MTSILVGLIGAGIQASRAPRMQESEGEALGLRYVYRLIDLDALGLGIEALSELVRSAERLGFTGLNITHPCKQAVIPVLDELSPEARAIGAVNVVLFRNGRRIGHNTDWSGFAESFRRGLPGVPLDRIVQLGAGGAGAAVAYALLVAGARQVALYDLDATKAEALAQHLASTFGAERAIAVADVPAAIAQAQGLVNATPVGMRKYPGLPLPAALLRPDLWLAELIYTPLETELLAAARALGCHTLDGGGMAAFQAAHAFRLFTGREADPERLLRHVEEG
jgi:quinate/shikimate dehydrogenase (NAD+)